MNSERLLARMREIRSHAAVRAWELRHLAYAGGVWFRVGRLLAFTRSAWEISEEEGEMLMARGYRPHPVGQELQPPRKFFVLSEQHLALVQCRKEIPLRASTELLGPTAMVLVVFQGLERFAGGGQQQDQN